MLGGMAGGAAQAGGGAGARARRVVVQGRGPGGWWCRGEGGMGFMVDYIMRNLLSKEVLYAPLKVRVAERRCPEPPKPAQPPMKGVCFETCLQANAPEQVWAYGPIRA